MKKQKHIAISRSLSLKHLLPAGIAIIGMILPVETRAEHLLNLGGRYHSEHHHFDKLPFGNGDISYLVGYTYAESVALWQLAVDFAPDVSGEMRESDEETTGDINYAVTPQLNLLIKDRYFRGGTGVRASYVEADDASEWLDPYWQLLLGLNMPLAGRLSLDAAATYVFDKWEHLDEFDFRDLEYNLTLNMSF